MTDPNRFRASAVPATALAGPCRSGYPSSAPDSWTHDVCGSSREASNYELPFHPCMHRQAHHTVPRLHLPVAPHCNTRCGYCERQVSHKAASVVAPGVSAAVLSPLEAIDKTRGFLRRWGKKAVIGIAGPGEPLANEQTFETLNLVRKEYPGITLCLCTNGLNLPDRCEDLRALRVQHLSVTINGFDPSIVAQIQPTVTKDGRVYVGRPAAEILIRNQEAGVQSAVEAGMFIKVNYVVIPEINGAHIIDTARKVRELGAGVFNPIPLIPRGRFRNMRKPDERYMDRLRRLCSKILPVFGHCKQCRADAEGIPGKEQAR